MNLQPTLGPADSSEMESLRKQSLLDVQQLLLEAQTATTSVRCHKLLLRAELRVLHLLLFQFSESSPEWVTWWERMKYLQMMCRQRLPGV